MKKVRIHIAIAGLGVALTAGMTAQAGSINGPESSMISAASGTFEYNGKTYVAKSEYLGQLYAKLSEDGVDVSATQAAELISQMYASVGEGVAQGVLMEVGGGEPETETETATETETETEKITETETETETVTETESETETGQQTEPSLDANDYKGYNINEIEQKAEEDRSDEEIAVYREFQKKKAEQEVQSQTDEPETATEETDRNETTEVIDGDPQAGFFQQYGLPIFIAIATLILTIFGGLTLHKKRRGAKVAAGLKEEGLTDIHSHILPGVDDGAEDMEMTMELLKQSYEQGVRTIVATPHYRIGENRRPVDEVRGIYEEVCQEAGKRFPDLQIYLGNELFYSDGIIDRVKEGRAMTLGDSRYVLVEYRTDEAYQRIQNSVIQFQRNRYIPIIAHVERYENVMKKPERLKELSGSGALLQVNAASAKKCSKYIRAGLIDVIGSDCHDLKYRLPNMDNALKVICEESTEEISEKVLRRRGNNILTGGSNKDK